MTLCAAAATLVAAYLLQTSSARGVSRRHVGGEVTVALPAPVRPADPTRITTLSEATYASMVHDTLYRVSADGTRIVPVVAAALPEAMGPGAAATAGSEHAAAALKRRATRWRIPLRAGAALFFHDGRPVTAKAVVASLVRMLEPATGSPHHWLLANIKGAAAFRKGKKSTVPGISAAGSTAIELQFIRAMDGKSVAYLMSSPATAIVAEGEAVPIGCGPFRPGSGKGGTKGGVVRLTANGRHPSGRPFVDRLVLRAFESAKAARSAFVIGDVQVSLSGGGAYGVSAGAPGARTEPSLSDLLRFGRTRTGHAILGRDEFRRAVDLAIDRAAIAHFTIGAGAVGAAGLVPPAYPMGRKASPLTADPAEATRLALRAARAVGEPLPTLRILHSRARAHHRLVAEKLVVALRAAGMDAELDGEEHDTFLDRLATRDFDLALDEVWLPAGHELVFAAMVAAAGYTDKATTLMTRGTYGDLRTALRIEKLVLASRAVIPLTFRPMRVHTRDGLHGVGFDPVGRLRLDNAFFASVERRE